MGKSKSNRATGVWPIRGRRHQAWLRRVASSRRVGGITRSNSTARRRGCGRRFSWGPALAAHETSGSCTTASDLPRPNHKRPHGRIGTSRPHPVEAVASSYGTTVAGAGSARRERSGIRGAAPVQSLMPHCPVLSTTAATGGRWPTSTDPFVGSLGLLAWTCACTCAWTCACACDM